LHQTTGCLKRPPLTPEAAITACAPCRSRHEAGDRPGDPDAPAALLAHGLAHAVQQVQGTGNIGFHYMLEIAEVLVKEGVAQPAAGVRA
jgi:hypothetical protein